MKGIVEIVINNTEATQVEVNEMLPAFEAALNSLEEVKNNVEQNDSNTDGNTDSNTNPKSNSNTYPNPNSNTSTTNNNDSSKPKEESKKPVKAVKNGWATKGNSKYYYLEGKLLKSKWLKTKDGYTYYFGSNSRMVKSKWIKGGSKTYYFNVKGRVGKIS